MLDFFVKNSKNQSTCKTTEVPNANNSNENRNKSCPDHDITMANAMNNELPHYNFNYVVWYAKFIPRHTLLGA